MGDTERPLCPGAPQGGVQFHLLGPHLHPGYKPAAVSVFSIWQHRCCSLAFHAHVSETVPSRLILKTSELVQIAESYLLMYFLPFVEKGTANTGGKWGEGWLSCSGIFLHSSELKIEIPIALLVYLCIPEGGCAPHEWWEIEALHRTSLLQACPYLC